MTEISRDMKRYFVSCSMVLCNIKHDVRLLIRDTLTEVSRLPYLNGSGGLNYQIILPKP